MKKKTLLTILAHPDDESFGPGGTLARYAAEGVDVHICIATDGAAGSVAEGHESARDNLVAVRANELEQAVRVLGGTLHRLDYRDSGMAGDPANEHPDNWINSDNADAIGRIVYLIRSLKPDVVMTHDETGGYFHPDHIRCWEITTQAYDLAGDPNAYPEHSFPAWTPTRLYYTGFSSRWTKMFATIARLRGQDPTAFGRNKDIDITKLGIDANKLHAHIDYRSYWGVKTEASAYHASQGGGGGGPFRFIPLFIRKRFLARDTFMRARPPAPDGHRETDLFS